MLSCAAGGGIIWCGRSESSQSKASCDCATEDAPSWDWLQTVEEGLAATVPPYPPSPDSAGALGPIAVHLKLVVVQPVHQPPL